MGQEGRGRGWRKGTQFSAAVIQCRAQGNLRKKRLILALDFRRLRVYHGWESMAASGGRGSKRWAWQQVMGVAASGGQGSKRWAWQQVVGVTASDGHSRTHGSRRTCIFKCKHEAEEVKL